ncbi:RBBP9/YdeN family alpha/beta hydrolase [Staphylococcus edaphicus]|uniref:Alpha/beta hydrolase n=1 Tax=Staphylococcus edaphicus TaxID=1955013 RepID=A0A2C6WRW3_9STAP|nr:alpha/beta hydrolase [Staphylococcus edaphicus]PHK50843.1 alpha/beta hydrolase [Staphylococcus edaphicus]UQW82536.1 alpha/beta hydrolase [Staphylococcus edaphicus]
MTDIIIVHSKQGDSRNHWYEWLADNLTLEGYNVTLCNIPVDENDEIENWLAKMKSQIHITHYETFFVTHGFGTLASLKFIEQADIDHIQGLFSISGFMEDAKAFLENDEGKVLHIDYDNVKQKVDAFYGLCAKNDSYISHEETKRLMDTLDGTCKVTEFGGHFMEDDGFTTFTRLQSKMQGIMSK